MHCYIPYLKQFNKNIFTVFLYVYIHFYEEDLAQSLQSQPLVTVYISALIQ